ncbi:hypothetical protein DFQ04_1883 [Algoriphagus boseongensis]|uniref:Uncharacterized protein n=1 Tax=Algoriphagus boseongensis TaxID=1442587 RepID=A0A4R6T440_9BACT|nr:hypothetical protein [Algoriphagus boseongensis]TDQ17231.1 hypothetical protein DFQ04_1883 [Algoriphagus boseongensis]
MKKFNSLLLIFLVAVLGFTSCIEGNEKPIIDEGGDNSSIVISSNITTNTTWETGKVYVLSGRISVVSGVTLTIQPGVIVKGEVGTGANATALVIARGAKINAAGTSTQPIIFTTVADEIVPGQIASPNLDPTLEGLWGGLLILGKAKGSFAGDIQEVQIEGIPASDTNGLYGGSENNDNSGVLKYVSIRHGGANIGEGNEINGLTLGGVGAATVIENIEIVANQDDGIEWFGGTVNVKNALVWNSGDDGMDTDQAWAGTLDNFIVICGSNTDHALEIDGPEGSFTNAGHTLSNGSIKGNPASEFADFRAGAAGTFRNLYFFNFPAPADNNNAGRGDLSLSGDNTIANFTNGTLKFSALQATLKEGVTLTQAFRNGTDVHATAVAAKANTVGADKSVFSNWTWASAANALADFK